MIQPFKNGWIPNVLESSHLLKTKRYMGFLGYKLWISIWKWGVSLVNTLIIVWYEVGFSWKTTEFWLEFWWIEFWWIEFWIEFWIEEELWLCDGSARLIEGSRCTAGIIFTGGCEWTCTIVAEVDGLEDVVDMIPLRGRSEAVMCGSSLRWPSTMPLVTAKTYSISSSRSSSDSEDHGRGC